MCVFGLGVGIVAGMALDSKEDQDLVSIEATHLFPVHPTWIGFLRDGLLRAMYDFLQILAPHLTRRVVDRAVECDTPEVWQHCLRVSHFRCDRPVQPVAAAAGLQNLCQLLYDTCEYGVT